jgi:CheY-like chemotaxis protein
MGAGVFRREGDFWTLSFEDKVVRVKDAKGTRFIARLLSKQGEELHVLDLAELDRLPIGPAAREAVLDASARASYKRRLRDLEDEIALADEIDDIAAAERARAERDAIVAELASAYGLGGRPRKALTDPIERARKAVTERIRTTISRIETVHPPLGRHLRRSVRTGTYCSYSPEKPVDWDMETPASQSSGAIRVVVVDDHPLWRATLQQVLTHDGLATVVGEASDGAEAVEVARRSQPDAILMDLHLPGMSGIEATRAVMDVCPEVKVLILSSSDVRTEVVEAVAAGACGYLLKTADGAEIADAIRRIAAGELVFPPPVSRMVLAELRNRP